MKEFLTGDWLDWFTDVLFLCVFITIPLGVLSIIFPHLNGFWFSGAYMLGSSRVIYRLREYSKSI